MVLLSEILIPNREIILPDDYKIFSKLDDYAMSQRKMDRYMQIAKIKAYYQRNPIKFMRDE